MIDTAEGKPPIGRTNYGSITCNRNVIDYIHFDPVIMVTF